MSFVESPFDRSLAKQKEALEPFSQVLALHQKAKEELANLREENSFLRTQIESLKGELAVAAASGHGGGPSSSSEKAAAANAAKLQTKLLELQDQLTEQYRTKAAETAKLLALSEANQRLKEESVAMQQRMMAAQHEAAMIAEDRDRTKNALKEREAQLSIAAEELVRVRRLLENKARECDDLRREFSSIETERQQFASTLAAAEAKAETVRKDRDKALANVQAAQATIGELMKAVHSQNNASGGGDPTSVTTMTMTMAAAMPTVMTGSNAALAVAGPSSGASSVASPSSFPAPALAHLAAATEPHFVAPPPAPPPQAQAQAQSQQQQQQAQQQGASGLLSWLGNRVSAVVQKATGAPPGSGPGSSAPGASSSSSSSSFSPGTSANSPSSFAGPSTTISSAGMGLSLYMSSSVAGLASDYVFASLSTPSKPLHIIRASAGPSSSFSSSSLSSSSSGSGGSEINAIRIHDTGRTVACGSSDGNITLWSLQSGTREGVLYTATEGNAVLSLDCAGTLVAGGCSDRTIRIFDLTTQRVVRSLTGHAGKVQALVYLPPTMAGNSAVASGGGAGGSGIGPTGGFTRGLLFSGAADRMVKLWDLRDGRCCRSIDSRSIVNGIAVSPDGQLLAVANQDSSIRLFDLRGSGIVAETNSVHSSAITSVSFSTHDGGLRLLTASRDNTLRVLDARTLEPLTSFAPPTGVPHERKASNDLSSSLRKSQPGASGSSTGGAGAGGSGSPLLSGLSSSSDSPVLRPPSADLTLGLGSSRTTRASSMSASGQQQQHPLASSTSSLSIVMKVPGFRVPWNASRAYFSPNGHYAVCGGDRGTVYSFNAETGALDQELGLSEAEVLAQQQQKRKGSFTTGSASAAGGGGGSIEYGSSSSFGSTSRTPRAFSDAGMGGGGPHEGAAILALDYQGYTMVSGDANGKIVIWGE